MTGYSGTPLPRKLGVKPGATLLLVAAPAGFDAVLGDLPPGARAVRRATAAPPDVVLAFVTRRAELARRLDGLAEGIRPDRALWIAWPKRASGVATDVTEDVVREEALPRGLVDVKVCAVDAVWSGLKLVWRRERR